MAGPLVAAAPGHYLILADYHPAKRVPVLAWRVGKRIALPVSYLGTWDGKASSNILMALFASTMSAGTGATQ